MRGAIDNPFVYMRMCARVPDRGGDNDPVRGYMYTRGWYKILNGCDGTKKGDRGRDRGNLISPAKLWQNRLIL